MLKCKPKVYKVKKHWNVQNQTEAITGRASAGLHHKVPSLKEVTKENRIRVLINRQ